MTPATQKNRLLAIGTELGEDTLLLAEVSIRETLGRMFQIEAQLLSTDTAINFDQIVGTNATVRLELPSGSTRHFNGYISRFSQGESQGKYARYRATLVPWMWFLTRTSDCRIFQKKTVPDILEDVFKAHGFKDYQLKLNDTYKPWEYCVQYRETDFQFVSRLMEHEGIYYFFEHAMGQLTLVLADSIGAHTPLPQYASIPYISAHAATLADEEHVESWIVSKEVDPGGFATNDYDFKKPRASLEQRKNHSFGHPNGEY